MTTQITMDEWLTEFERLTAAPDAPGDTVAELCAKWRHGEKWVRQRVTKAVAIGTMECAGRRRVIRLDGQAALVPVYRRVRRIK